MIPLVPDHRQSAVARAMLAAFDRPAPDQIVPLTGGLSGAQVFRITVDGKDHVLRLDGPQDNMVPAPVWYATMHTAARHGLAPGVRHADPDDRVMILDFIPPRSLATEFPGSRQDLMRLFGSRLNQLHQTPGFPVLVDYLDGVQSLLDGLMGTGLFEPSVLRPVLDLYGELVPVYRQDAPPLVASHNDLNPRNILFDGQQIWFVDWEAAFQADPYVDLASVANVFAHSAEDREALLGTYFGRPATGAETARMGLMQLINHVFYGAVMAVGVAGGHSGPPLGSLSEMSLAAIHQGMGDGSFDLDAPGGQLTYARARLSAGFEGLTSSDLAGQIARLRS